MTTTERTIDYFKNKADKYDLVENQKYWNLSDKLLWHSLSEWLDTLPANFRFLDAGGGTGRWSFKILQNYPQSTGCTYDLSKDMLNIAKEKQSLYNLEDRWNIHQGDLHKLSDVPDESVDISFNFHNVLGFVESPIRVIAQITSKVKKGGYVISFVPNQYHSMYFNLSLGKITEAEKCAKGKGRFTDEMPEIFFFTPKSISEIYEVNQLKGELLTGFPSFFYPSYLETQLEGNTKRITDVLSDDQSFQRIYELEKRFLKEDLSIRSNNIFIVGRKVQMGGV